MAKTSNRQYAVALYEAVKDVAESDYSTIITNFVEVLIKNHKIRQADRIVAEFERYAKKMEGLEDIDIVSAKILDDEVINAIKTIFGGKVNAINTVDENLLGGVKIKTDEVIFDASIKTQLNKLKYQISK